MRFLVILAAVTCLGPCGAAGQEPAAPPSLLPTVVDKGGGALQGSAAIQGARLDAIGELEANFPGAEMLKIARHHFLEAGASTRSAKDVRLYRSVSPAVVLVATKTGIGSGSLISTSGEILTNWHVVNGYSLVAVVFKPAQEGATPGRDDMKLGHVVKFDPVSDLALVKVDSMPADRRPIRLGDSSEISVGADVHAIGHPQGQQWTYTNGIISQYRRGYDWSNEGENIKHKADVIQTQTPINGGSSGGPLISDSETLIGVNSFKAPESEGLNFAVSVDDVRKFIARPNIEPPQGSKGVVVAKGAKGVCEAREIGRSRNKSNDAAVIVYDWNCGGKANAQYIVPDRKDQPITLEVDRNNDGRVDVVFYDLKRRQKWDISYWDANFEGQWTLVGYHEDGGIKPTKFESYADFKKRVASQR
jgi:S1-C subfamily serine protease